MAKEKLTIKVEEVAFKDSSFWLYMCVSDGKYTIKIVRRGDSIHSPEDINTKLGESIRAEFFTHRQQIIHSEDIKLLEGKEFSI